MDLRAPVVGLVVAGLAAPGINGVICSATIEAVNAGCAVIGFFDGFKHLKTGRAKIAMLTVEGLSTNTQEHESVSGHTVYSRGGVPMIPVNRIYSTGGSILRTSLEQLRLDQEVDDCLRVLQFHRIRHLIVIGGTDSAHSASLLARAAKMNFDRGLWPVGLEAMSLVHVPKSIFNDLPLPVDSKTFGFVTARDEGTKLVNNFIMDSQTMLRFYVLVVAGPKSGHLALAIGKAAAATLTIIPEDFESLSGHLTIDMLIRIIEGCIFKRKAHFKQYGVIIVCDGVVDLLSDGEVLTKFGNVQTAREDLGRFIVGEINKNFKQRVVEATVVTANIGNELRSADPSSYDILLTRDLGYGAVRFLLEGGSGSLLTVRDGNVVPLPLESLLEQQQQQHGYGKASLMPAKTSSFALPSSSPATVARSLLSPRRVTGEVDEDPGGEHGQGQQEHRFIEKGRPLERRLSDGGMSIKNALSTTIRRIDIHSMYYQIARRFMLPLRKSDLENPIMLQRLATVSKLGIKHFLDRYEGVAANSPTQASLPPGVGMLAEVPIPIHREIASPRDMGFNPHDDVSPSSGSRPSFDVTDLGGIAAGGISITPISSNRGSDNQNASDRSNENDSTMKFVNEIGCLGQHAHDSGAPLSVDESNADINLAHHVKTECHTATPFVRAPNHDHAILDQEHGQTHLPQSQRKSSDQLQKLPRAA